MTRKQYQIRLSEKSAEYLDKAAAKHLWTPSTTLSVMMATYERLEKIAACFEVSHTTEGEEMMIFTNPVGDTEFLDDEALAVWLIKEVKKDLICVFSPEQGSSSFTEELDGPHPNDAVGRAMIAAEGHSGNYTSHPDMPDRKGKK